jgi:hypothetical protein
MATSAMALNHGAAAPHESVSGAWRWVHSCCGWFPWLMGHKELIMLATNKFNLLKQEGTWGAKSPDEDKIIAMQAELTALRGRF